MNLIQKKNIEDVKCLEKLNIYFLATEDRFVPLVLGNIEDSAV